MKGQMDAIGRIGLKYFGAMSASISHDIKNVLAVMNENAGLIRDLLFMTRKGAPLDVDKVDGLAGRFEQQIRRADDIVKGLNQFAHSVDAEEKTLETGEALALVTALATRFISMKGVSVTLAPSEGSCPLTIDPFVLNNLLWFGLKFALDHPGPDKKLTLACSQGDGKVLVYYRGLGPMGDGSGTAPLLGQEGQVLAESLGAEVRLEADSASLVIGFARNING